VLRVYDQLFLHTRPAVMGNDTHELLQKPADPENPIYSCAANGFLNDTSNDTANALSFGGRLDMLENAQRSLPVDR
jgi:hypothetical protein